MSDWDYESSRMRAMAALRDVTFIPVLGINQPGSEPSREAPQAPITNHRGAEPPRDESHRVHFGLISPYAANAENHIYEPHIPVQANDINNPRTWRMRSEPIPIPRMTVSILLNRPLLRRPDRSTHCHKYRVMLSSGSHFDFTGLHFHYYPYSAPHNRIADPVPTDNLKRLLEYELAQFTQHVQFSKIAHKWRFQREMADVISMITTGYYEIAPIEVEDFCFWEVCESMMRVSIGYSLENGIFTEINREEDEIERAWGGDRRRVMSGRWREMYERHRMIEEDPRREADWDRIIRDEYMEPLPLYVRDDGVALPLYKEKEGLPPPYEEERRRNEGEERRTLLLDSKGNDRQGRRSCGMWWWRSVTAWLWGTADSEEDE